MAEDDLDIRSDLLEYAQLIKSFVDRKISGSEFESGYLELIRNDSVIHGEAFKPLDELFYWVDEYWEDPEFTAEELRKEEENLRSQAGIAFEKLLRFKG